jgi:hypothetical protein
MDPLSISVSALAIITASIKSAKSLCATVSRYKDQDKTLERLEGELESLTSVLGSLEAAVGSDPSIWGLLRKPVDRCKQTCREFEDAMERFGRKSKSGIKVWAKMEFMRDNIKGFVDTLATYKSTIMVGLGIITM